MNCPRCNYIIQPGMHFCPSCNFPLAQVNFQQPSIPTISKKEKVYRNLLIVLAVFYVCDGIVWRIIQKLAETFGYEIYDYMDPYRWLTTPAYSALPGLVGFLLPKNTVWRLILIIGGSIWFALRMFEFIRQETGSNDFIFFEF